MNNILRLLILYFFVFVFLSSCASLCKVKNEAEEKELTSIIVSGTVKDSIEGKPLISANVKIESAGKVQETKTDEFGVFSAEVPIQEGKDIKITVEQEGFAPSHKVIRSDFVTGRLITGRIITGRIITGRIITGRAINVDIQADFVTGRFVTGRLVTGRYTQNPDGTETMRTDSGEAFVTGRLVTGRIVTGRASPSSVLDEIKSFFTKQQEGEITVEITVGDPDRNLNSFPGDFKAQDEEAKGILGISGIEEVELKALGWTSLSFKQGGKDVQVASPENPVMVMRRLPESLQKDALEAYKRGANSIPLYSYDAEDGIWKRHKEAKVVIFKEDTDGDGILDEVAYGEMSLTHTSWWSFGCPTLPRNVCVKGKVIGADGKPVSGVYVTASELRRYGEIVGQWICSGYRSTYTISDENGEYILYVPSNSNIRIFATDRIYAWNGRIYGTYGEISGVKEFSVGDKKEGCYEGPTLSPPSMFSVSCFVKDEEGNPIQNANVVSSEGKATKTDSSGNFSLISRGGNITITISTEKDGRTYKAQKTLNVDKDITAETCQFSINLSPLKVGCKVFVNSQPAEGVEVFVGGNNTKTKSSGDFEVFIPRPTQTEDVKITYIAKFPDGSTEGRTEVVRVKPEDSQVSCQGANFEYVEVCAEGQVRDKEGKGLRGVSVIVGDRSPVFTDEDGFFKVRGGRAKKSEEGRYRYKVKFIYQTSTTQEIYEKEYEAKGTECVWSEQEIDTRPAWVQGTIQSKRGNHIPGVRVETEFGEVDYTNSGGQFKLEAPPNTKVKIYASYKGVRVEREIQTKEKGSTASVDITLEIEDASPLIKIIQKGQAKAGGRAKLKVEFSDDSSFLNYSLSVTDWGYSDSGSIILERGKAEKEFEIQVPQGAKTALLVLQAQDSGGNKDTVSTTIEVKKENRAPRVIKIGTTGGIWIGREFVASAVVNEPDGDDVTFAWEITKDGVKFDWITPYGATAVVKVPQTADGGEYVLRVVVRDSEGAETVFEKKVEIKKENKEGEIVCVPKEEVCDGIDNDCDGEIDEGVKLTFYQDKDSDGYGNPGSVTEACTQPQGYVSNSQDCDDERAEINPNTVWFKDSDSDGYTDGTTRISCLQPQGYVLYAMVGDCNDNNPNIKPGATEICDGIDNDCDGEIDEGVLLVFYKDADSDGYTDGAVQVACGPTSPYNLTTITLLDCDDSVASIYPGAPLNCNNGKDNDCSGHIETWFWEDRDSDTWTTSVSTCANTMPAGFTSVSKPEDCDDLNPDVNPGTIWYKDADFDGYYPVGGSQVSCTDPYPENSTYAVLSPGDCDDNNANLNPETIWYKDADFDGYYPEGGSQVSCTDPYPENSTYAVLSPEDCDDNNANLNPGTIWYKDADFDGYYPVGGSQVSCTDPYPDNSTYAVLSPGDCDDSNSSINPGQTEVCDGIDNNCAGGIDEGFEPCSAPSNLTYFFVSADTVGLRWQDNSPNEQGFVVEVSTDSLFSNPQIQTFSANTTEGYITSLQEKTTYYFRVYAFNSTGNTAYSNIISATTSSIYFEGAIQISSGGYHTCAVKTDNSLWCWGRNEYGQLGNGTTAPSSAPVQIMATGVSQVSLGWWHTCAIKTDNSLWCWGWNEFGQLGDGTWTNRYTPVQIMATGVSQVSLGWWHTCAVKTDGSLWCWGDNRSGQLGDGTGVYYRDTPVQIMATGVSQVSLGAFHTCAVKTDGSLWCWGSNNRGQLGDGTNENKNTPVQIMATGVSQVSLGGWHTCAIKTDGSLWCWGENYFGQLGNGTTQDRNTPVQITQGVSQVSLGGEHTCAVKTDNSLWCWGWNAWGQLGDGTWTHRSTPVRVLSGSGGGGGGGAPQYFGTSQTDQTEFTSDQDQELTSKFGCSVSGFGYLIFISALPLILLLRKRKKKVF